MTRPMNQPTPPAPVAAPPRPTVIQMNLTPEMCAAISALQGKLPKIERDRMVEVETKGDKPNYGYSYATLSNITEKIMPLLSEQGLGYVGLPGLIDQASGRSSMGLRYLLTHSSGGYIMGEFPLAGEGGIQGTGGRITYARRYCLLAVTGLAPDEDDDAANAQAEDEATAGTARRAGTRNRARQEAAPAGTSGSTAARQTRQPRDADRTAPARDQVAPERPADDVPDPNTEGVTTGPRNPDLPITNPQMTKIILLFKDLGVKVNNGAEYTRETRIKMMSSLVGRPIESGKDMTMGEAHRVIDLVGDALQRRDPIKYIKDRVSGGTGDPADTEQATA